MIIGITGYIGSGKDTVAKLLCDNHGFTRFAFGDILKNMLIEAGLMTYEEAYITKPEWARLLFQRIGTNIFRKQVDEDYWIKALRPKLIEFFETKGIVSDVVVSDVRFINEASSIRYDFNYMGVGGFILNVIRFTALRTDHESETEHERVATDYVFTNNYTIEDAASRIGSLVESMRKGMYTKRLI